MREICKGNGVKPGRKDNQGFIGFKRIFWILQSIHYQSNARTDIIGRNPVCDPYKTR